MSDNSSTNDGSDENRGDAGASNGGSSDDGQSGGTNSGGDTFASERKLWEERTRSFQSQADQAKTRADKLEAELAALKGNGNEGSGTVDAEAIVARSVQASAQAAAKIVSLVNARADLEKEFPYADSSIFSELEKFDSVESLRMAAEASHQRTEALIQPAVKQREEEIRKRLTEQGYTDLGPVDKDGAGDGGGSAGGDPTYAQILQMTPDELDALGDETIERVSRAAGVSA